ncbi:hypothetical protein BD413DRAFT_67072 [Trametes elegans]|nr:hypothetical protein BD413DRAFT_67072 [Trametes elegans]
MTGTLMYALLRNRTGFKRTDNTIATLAMYAINTGVVTGIVNVLVFVFGLIQPDNYVWIGLALTSSRLYANAVMAMLNSRKSLISAMFEDCVDTETVGAQLGLPRIPHPVTTTSLEPGHVVPVTLHIMPGGQYDARRGPSLQRIGSLDSGISRSISRTKIEHGPKSIAPDRPV